MPEPRERNCQQNVSRRYVFAGETSSNTLNDLHRYDIALDSWTELTGTTGRSRHTAIWDESGDRMIVFGGLDSSSNRLGSLLIYDRATDAWSTLAATGPAAREGHVAVWDPSSHRMLMCCGLSDAATLGDLWSYDGAWTQLSPSGSITARRYASAVWDPAAQAMLGFGGRGSSLLGSLFLYSSTADSWSEYTESGPGAQEQGAVAWDEGNRRLYTYAGKDSLGGLLAKLWRLDASHTSQTSTSSSTSTSITRTSSTSLTSSATTSISSTSISSTTSISSSSVSSSTTASSTLSSTQTSSTTESQTMTVSSSSSSSTVSTTETATQTQTTMFQSSTTTSKTSSATTTQTTTSQTSTTTSQTLSSTKTQTTTSETSTWTSSTSTTASETSSTATTETTTSATSTRTSSTSSTVSRTSSTASSQTVTTGTSTQTGSTTTSVTMSSTTSTTSTMSSTTSTTSTTTSATSSSTSTSTLTATTSSATLTDSTTSTSSATATGTVSSTSSRSRTETVTVSESLTSTASTTSTVMRIVTSTTTDASATVSSSTSSSTAPSSTTTANTGTTTSSNSPLGAEILLGELETAEKGLARQLLATLDQNSTNASDGIIAEAVAQSELAITRTLALDSDILQSLGRTLRVQGQNASLEIPPIVVSQAADASGVQDGLVILSFSVGDADFAAELAGNAAAEDLRQSQLVSRPVSVTFRGADGAAIPMPALSAPIEIHLPDANTQAICAFWDEAASTWSTKGVQRVESWEGEGILCRTSHLTVFAAIFDTFVNVLRCSTAAQIFSPESFMNLGSSAWVHYSSSIITFSALGLFLLLLIYAFRLDRKRFTSRRHLETSLLVEGKQDCEEAYDEVHEEDAEEPVAAKDKAEPGCCHRVAASTFANFTWCLGVMFETPEADLLAELLNAKEVFVNRCISAIYAYASQADWQSIRAAETDIGEMNVRHWETSALSVTVRDFVHMNEKVDHRRKKAFAARQFLSSPFVLRVLLLVRAKHPWIALQFVSLFRSHTIRAALLILKLVSAAATNALFFSGSAMSGSSDAGCVPETFAERVWRATIIGLLSACLGDVLIVLMALVQRRRVIVRERWTPKEKARQLRRWRLRSFLFWLLWLLDCGLAVTYVLVFLANVSATDGRKWIESTGMSLLQDLVLKPFYLAFGYGTVASIVLCCSSRVREPTAHGLPELRKLYTNSSPQPWTSDDTGTCLHSTPGLHSQTASPFIALTPNRDLASKIGE
ncbi:Zan [Symbiodinium sp. CCMP2456]|nr:Zan [Symbiodinium sp. CCMP2456]